MAFRLFGLVILSAKEVDKLEFADQMAALYDAARFLRGPGRGDTDDYEIEGAPPSVSEIERIVSGWQQRCNQIIQGMDTGCLSTGQREMFIYSRLNYLEAVAGS